MKIFGLQYSEIFHERRSLVFGIQKFFMNEDLRSSVFGKFLRTKIFGLRYSENFHERRSSVFGIRSISLFGATLLSTIHEPATTFPRQSSTVIRCMSSATISVSCHQLSSVIAVMLCLSVTVTRSCPYHTLAFSHFLADSEYLLFDNFI